MSTLRRRALAVSALLLSSGIFGCVSSGPRAAADARSAAPRELTVLAVGLYPDVPRVAQFEDAIAAAWAKVQPHVSLTFLSSTEWDGGYAMDPPANADVFVFDALFLEYFQSRGYLEALAPSEIDHRKDFLPYAIDGVRYGGSYYGIPQLGCTNILFHLETDAALENASTLSAVQSALGTCTYSSEVPPDRRGLMVDLSGGTTSASFYLDAAHSLTGKTPALPWSSAELDPQALARVQSLLAMASYRNGTASTSPYERSEWYSEGWGRGVVGFTESMSVMSADTRSHTDLEVLPLSDTATPPYFYADVVGVNTTTKARGTRALAVQLANVMAAEDTMVAATRGTATEPSPQFLMPVRPSIFTALEQQDPMYGEMYRLVSEGKPVLFKINAQSRRWLAAMKDAIKAAIRSDYPCPCDFPAARQIVDDNEAEAICHVTCADHGGWTGRWSNVLPAGQGDSVCGCSACSTP